MNLDGLKLSFDHSVQEMEIILQGLRKLPIEIALEIHNKLHLGAKAMVDSHLAQQIEKVADTPVEVPATTDGSAPAEPPQA
jgi:hypothetical protein